MSLVFNMVGGSSGGGSDTYAFIIVAYPVGSTCTATDGTTTLTAPDTSGSWVCKVPNAGTWTITSTDGTDTATAQVIISAEGQSESVELLYRLYLYNRGDQCTSITGGWSNNHGGGSGVNINTDNIEIYQIATSGRGASVYSTNQINFTDYSTIHFLFTNSAAGPIVKGGIADVTSYTTVTFLAATEFPASASEAEMVVDISAYTGLHYPRVNGGTSTLRIYAVWLE